MKPIGVFYATREGHTRRIAKHVAVSLRARGLDPDVRNLRNEVDYISLKNYGGAILLASLHRGEHEQEMIEFARLHRAELEAMPSALISVSLTQAAAERRDSSPEERERRALEVQKSIDHFLLESGWRPARVKPIAGALLYSKYNFLLRLVMKRIAKKAGGDTDASRDYVYTDWQGLDQFVEQYASGVCAIA